MIHTDSWQSRSFLIWKVVKSNLETEIKIEIVSCTIYSLEAATILISPGFLELWCHRFNRFYLYISIKRNMIFVPFKCAHTGTDLKQDKYYFMKRTNEQDCLSQNGIWLSLPYFIISDYALQKLILICMVINISTNYGSIILLLLCETVHFDVILPLTCCDLA